MMVMVAALLEPMSESIPLGIYMSWSVYHFFEFNPYLYFVLHWVTWCALDYLQLRGVQVCDVSNYVVLICSEMHYEYNLITKYRI